MQIPHLLDQKNLKEFLDQAVAQYNQPNFIENDPICIPHAFEKKQDIEIMGFWAAVLAWGNRTTIIKKCKELVQLMDGTPHDFILNHEESDLKAFLSFKHRTFNATDTLYFLHFFQQFYQKHDSLEEAFTQDFPTDAPHVEKALKDFHELFFSLKEYPERTRKHIATPARKSACKRINMFLRWMVRKDDASVDFGIWKSIAPADLMIPLDVHVARISTQLGLLKRSKNDWLAVEELTANLRRFDPADPVKYDFALFGMGVNEEVL